MDRSQLAKHAEGLKQQRLAALFAEDSERFNKYSLTAGPLFLDYSKNLVNDNVLQQLVNELLACDFIDWRNKLLNGAVVNNTESRAAHHTLLRQPDHTLPQFVLEAKKQQQHFVHDFRQEKLLGYSKKPLKYVVNIGIGGSHLGSEMVVRALKDHQNEKPIATYFLANIDPSATQEVLAKLSPEETLFVVASKTFTTQETMTNASRAKQWLTAHGCPDSDLKQHFVAVTSAADKALTFGIKREHIFPIWDFVGGRYSLWSAIGLPIALSLGWAQYTKLLQGAHQMDLHFADAEPEQNMPVIMALLSVWYQHYWGTSTHAIVPYAQKLDRLVPYLQQLIMESNGKGCSREGRPLSHASAPVIWGDVGTNGQHAFHQLLHQGTQLVPVDFILVASHSNSDSEAERLLAANCLAQARALMVGCTHDQDPHRSCNGNRPSNTLLLHALSAEGLGALLALYEHKTFVESILYGINPFDQFGVELGKHMATALRPLLTGEDDMIGLEQEFDSSTRGLAERLRTSG